MLTTRYRDPRPTVLISIPNTGWIHKLVCLKSVELLADSRVRSMLILPTWRPYEQSLNRIAKDMLDRGFDFWLNIDSDNPPMENPLDLVELDLEIVGCPTPMYKNLGDGSWPICWNVVDMVADSRGRESEGSERSPRSALRRSAEPPLAEWKEHAPREGLQAVDAVGTGCVLFNRRVLEAMEPPWFVREYDSFGRTICGPDFRFCREASRRGFQTWAAYTHPCRHFNEVELCEAIQGFSGNVSQ